MSARTIPRGPGLISCGAYVENSFVKHVSLARAPSNNFIIFKYSAKKIEISLQKNSMKIGLKFMPFFAIN